MAPMTEPVLWRQKLATGCTKLVTDIRKQMQELMWGGWQRILDFRAIEFGGDVVESTNSIRITSGHLSISPDKIIWLFPDNFLVSLTTKCIMDDLLLTFVNKIVQPFELVLEIHYQLADSGQNELDNNL